jgi:hypothetical protein
MKLGRLSCGDREFIKRMTTSMDEGKRGAIFILNEDDSLDYLIANDTYSGAIELFGRMSMRSAREIQKNGKDS